MKFEYVVCRFCKNVEICSVLILRSIFSTDTNWHREKVTLKQGPPRGERVHACMCDLMAGDIVTQLPLMALVPNLPTLLQVCPACGNLGDAEFDVSTGTVHFYGISKKMDIY